MKVSEKREAHQMSKKNINKTLKSGIVLEYNITIQNQNCSHHSIVYVKYCVNSASLNPMTNNCWLIFQYVNRESLVIENHTTGCDHSQQYICISMC